MDIEWLRRYCLSLPATSEDIKWGNDLCFLVGGKMFCVAGLEQPLSVAFKVPDEIFEELSASDGIIPAPYMARNKWVKVQNVNKLNRKQWEQYIAQSYTLIKNKLPKKFRKELGIE